MKKLKIGDIVLHKTGKQKMIIVKIIEEKSTTIVCHMTIVCDTTIICRWEKDGQLFNDVFQEYELKLDKNKK